MYLCSYMKYLKILVAKTAVSFTFKEQRYTGYKLGIFNLCTSAVKGYYFYTARLKLKLYKKPIIDTKPT